MAASAFPIWCLRLQHYYVFTDDVHTLGLWPSEQETELRFSCFFLFLSTFFFFFEYSHDSSVRSCVNSCIESMSICATKWWTEEEKKAITSVSAHIDIIPFQWVYFVILFAGISYIFFLPFSLFYSIFYSIFHTVFSVQCSAFTFWFSQLHSNVARRLAHLCFCSSLFFSSSGHYDLLKTVSFGAESARRYKITIKPNAR